jgi:hypothetical protein
MKISHLAIILFALTDLSPLLGEWSLDVLDEALTYARPERNVQADFSVLADLELYLPETPSPGLLFPDDEAWLNPRLAVFFDLSVGSVVQIHSQMRVDRGFDPGSVPSGEGRLDEYYLRVSPLEDDRVAFKVGKFATAFGNWATRNLSWDNPFVTAPLAYEDVLNVSDVTMPRSAQALVGRRRVADRKGDWLTAIWGPSYASGASVSGRIEKLDYAFEVKNAALSSRPDEWVLTQRGLDQPTITARLGARPTPEWAFGTSFSHGSYTLESVGSDPDQTTYGIDASYQHHHLQIWGEVIYTQFEIPAVGDADAVSYYLETRYKVTPQLWAALRWNHSLFGSVPDGAGGQTPWDRDAWRVDLSFGWRFSRHWQAKIQGSVGGREGNEVQGNHLLAAQLTLKF